MGVMKPLLSKLTKLLEEEYVKFKGVRKQIKFLRDELRAMSATLEDLADADPEKLNSEVRLFARFSKCLVGPQVIFYSEWGKEKRDGWREKRASRPTNTS